MVIEFDPAKETSNLAKHGWSLSEFALITGAVIYPAQTVKGEPRHKVVGYIGAELVTTVITYRTAVIRVISLRDASRKERNDYASQTP